MGHVGPRRMPAWGWPAAMAACHRGRLPPRRAALHSLSWHPLGNTTVPVPSPRPWRQKRARHSLDARMAVNSQHTQPLPPAHEFPTDAARRRASHEAGGARLPSEGKSEQIFPHLSSVSQDSPDEDSAGPCSELCRRWAVLCQAVVAATGSGPHFGGDGINSTAHRCRFARP